MKTKNLIRIILGAALLLAPVLTFAQQRSVDWIHGLGGDLNSWQNVNDTYINQGRQIIQNSRFDYNTGLGIQGFANQVMASSTGGGNTISISHSMGGTAVREVDLSNGNYWAGNLTVGSPLSGGLIAISSQNGVAQQFINRGNTGSPKINVWGNEDNPVLWRVAGSYAGDTDQSGVDFINTAAGVYNTAANAEYVTSWIFPFIIFHGYWTWRGDQWAAGRNWLQNTSNWGWQAVIGSGYEQTQWVQVLEYSELCYQEMQWCADSQNAGQCDDSQCMNWIWVEMPVFVVDQSDGVVPAHSARNDGGAWRGHIVEAPGTNHKELLQYGQVHDTFDPIFNGVNNNGMQIFQIGQ